MNTNLIDKVLYLNNRVWTIYATTDFGVFCFQGVKPYKSFKFDSNNNRRNISYFHIEDVEDAIIEGEEIEWCMKKMENADKKKLTKQHAIEFYVHLTGHSKSFVSKNIEVNKRAMSDSFLFKPGAIKYDLWKMDGALLLSHNIHGLTNHTYFDFLTFDHHSRLNKENEEAYRQQIIDEHTD